MSDMNWSQVLVSLVSGGTFGAIVTLVVSHIRNRIQPVGRRVEITPVFTDTFENTGLETHIAVSDGKRTVNIDNLFLVNLELYNKGNKDFSKFPCGITLSNNDKA